MKEYNLNILKKNLLSDYRTSLNSLVHIGTLTHKEEADFVKRMDEVIYISEELTKREIEEQLLFKFRQNNPQLIKEYAKYRNSNRKDGMNLSLNLDLWLLRFKKIDYRKVKEDMKGGLKK